MKYVTPCIVSILLWPGIVACEKENLNAPAVSDQEFTTDENTPAGTIIGTVNAYDLDQGQSLSYAIIEGNDAGTFGIDARAGQVSVEDPLLLDYELNREFNMTVKVSDDGKPVMSSTATITVILKDVNEFAPVVEDQVFEIEEDPAAGTVIGTIQASDPETHQLLSYVILTGNEEDIFNLDDQTGVLSVNDPSAFVYQLNQQLVITVLVRDLHIDSKSDTAIITVNIKPK
jgi:hypothetical protein